MSEPAPVFGPGLKTSIEDAVRAIPNDRRGKLTAGVTLAGAEVSVGYRVNTNVTLGAYGRRLWKTGELQAGALASVVW